MKKIMLFILCAWLLKNAEAQSPVFKNAIKWTPTGLLAGNISLHGEHLVTAKSFLTTTLGIPVSMHRQLDYNGDMADFKMKASSFMLGYRHYLSKRAMHGIYIEPYAKYVKHSSEGDGKSTLEGEPVIMHFTNQYNGAGVGASMGIQFMLAKRVVFDFFFLGPEINLSKDHFKAVDVTNSKGWNAVQSDQAEQDIRDFLNKYPFIKNRVDVNVDQPQRTVTADFKGALPGYRAGISVGVAF